MEAKDSSFSHNIGAQISYRAQSTLEMYEEVVERMNRTGKSLSPSEQRILYTEYVSLYSFLVQIQSQDLQKNSNLFITPETQFSELLELYPILIQILFRAKDDILVVPEEKDTYDLGRYVYVVAEGTIRDKENNILVTLTRNNRKFFFLLCQRGFKKYRPEDFTTHKGRKIAPDSLSTYMSRLRQELEPLHGYIKVANSYGRGYHLVTIDNV